MKKWMFAVGLALVGGCADRGSCKAMLNEACQSCNVADYVDDLYCSCVFEGEINDADDYYPDDPEAAEEACFRIQQAYDPAYVTEEESRTCSADLAYLLKYEDDACESLGYE